MQPNLRKYAIIAIVCMPAAGCGFSVPEKKPFEGDARTSTGGSIQGDYESKLIDHITCEVAKGLQKSTRFKDMKWFFDKWGYVMTLSVSSEDQSGVAPGVTTVSPMRNVLFPFSSGGTVTAPQYFSFSVGGSASVNSIRTETIEFTTRNKDVINLPCDEQYKGSLIDGNLKIEDFIYDKSVIVALKDTYQEKSDAGRPAYNGWTEEITFVSAFGGNVTPTWKLATFASGTSSNLLVAERTDTNDLVITFGPLADDSDKTKALSLSKEAMAQHFARVQASAIAVSATGQTH